MALRNRSPLLSAGGSIETIIVDSGSIAIAAQATGVVEGEVVAVIVGLATLAGQSVDVVDVSAVLPKHSKSGLPRRSYRRRPPPPVGDADAVLRRTLRGKSRLGDLSASINPAGMANVDREIKRLQTELYESIVAIEVAEEATLLLLLLAI